MSDEIKERYNIEILNSSANNYRKKAKHAASRENKEFRVCLANYLPSKKASKQASKLMENCAAIN